MEYYSAIKNNDFFFPFGTTWMDPESIMLSEINQTEKYRYCMISLISEILRQKQKQMNKHNKSETDSQIYRTNRWLQEGRGFWEGEK